MVMQMRVFKFKKRTVMWAIIMTCLMGSFIITSNNTLLGEKITPTLDNVMLNPSASAPILNSPLNGEIIGDPQPILSWYSVLGATNYWLQLDDEPTFSVPYRRRKG